MKVNRNVNKYIKDCKHFFPFLSKNEKTFLKRLKTNIILKKAIIICTVAILVCCLWRGILIYKSYRDSENSKVKYIEYTIEEVD